MVLQTCMYVLTLLIVTCNSYYKIRSKNRAACEDYKSAWKKFVSTLRTLRSYSVDRFPWISEMMPTLVCIMNPDLEIRFSKPPLNAVFKKKSPWTIIYTKGRLPFWIRAPLGQNFPIRVSNWSRGGRYLITVGTVQAVRQVRMSSTAFFKRVEDKNITFFWTLFRFSTCTYLHLFVCQNAHCTMV